MISRGKTSGGGSTWAVAPGKDTLDLDFFTCPLCPYSRDREGQVSRFCGCIPKIVPNRNGIGIGKRKNWKQV